MKMKKVSFLLGITIFILMTSLGVDVMAQTPFALGNEVAITKRGMNSATPAYSIYLNPTPTVSGAFTKLVDIPTNTTRDINGIGLNPDDRLIYAAAYDPSMGGTPLDFTDDVNLLRIGADGSFTDLGHLPFVSSGGSYQYINSAVGAVTSSGSYVYMTIALTNDGVTKVSQWYFGGQPAGGPGLTLSDIRGFIAQIDNVSTLSSAPVSPSSSQEIDFTSDPNVQTAFQAYVNDLNAKFPDIGNLNGGIKDIDFDNSGKFYAYLDYPQSTGSNSILGFAVTLGTPANGKTPMQQEGTIINSAPGTESDGLAFDDAGNLNILFTNGQYAQINLTDGSLSGLQTSNIPTTNGNLRGDLAKMLPTTLPVHFGEINANIIDGKLLVNWRTESETNNSYFEIEASKDGKNFIKIGSVASIANEGTSNTALDYTFESDGALQLGALFFSMGLIFIGFKRRKNSALFAAGIVFILITLISVSCSRNDQLLTKNDNSSLYIRIKQVDKNGNNSFSDVVKAVARL